MRENGSIGPLDLGMHVGESLKQAGGQIREGAEDNPPHSRQGLHVIHGTVRHGVAAKCFGHILELVRHKPG